MLEDFRAFRFAKEFHWACKDLKVSRYLQDQLLRASSSVVLNLAEGSAKRTAPEQRRFYNIALASLRECEAILGLEKIEDSDLLKKMDQLGAILFTLGRCPENGTSTKTDRDTVDSN
jgi:four helix bundle protein